MGTAGGSSTPRSVGRGSVALPSPLDVPVAHIAELEEHPWQSWRCGSTGAPEVETDDPDIPLLYVLRDDLKLTGTSSAAASPSAAPAPCSSTAARCARARRRRSAVAGQEIVTIEGLGTTDRPEPLQAAFIAEQAAQCGYCTAGMVMTARARSRHAAPTRAGGEPLSPTRAARHACPRDPRGDPRRRHAGRRRDGRGHISRRAFLPAGGALIVALWVRTPGGGAGPHRARRRPLPRQAALPGRARLLPGRARGWLR